MTRVLFQPQTRDALKTGIDAIADAVTPTLGPLTGPVALEDSTRKGSPELLDDAGSIARRILQLEDRDADVGAMLLRETLWRQREQYGDGSAIAAVLYQTVFAEGHRFIRDGGNPMLLRSHLARGARLVLEALREQVRIINKASEIERLALSICGDGDIAKVLADIFDVLSPHHPIELRDGGRELQHEFFLGSYWESKVPSSVVFEGIVGGRIDLENTVWVISDFELDNLNALVELVTGVYESGYDSLAIVAKSFSDQVIAAQGANSQMADFKLVYLELTGLLDEQEAALEDLAQMTGGQALRTIAGHRLNAITSEMLGSSELAWVDRARFGVIAGGGDEAITQEEIAALERQFLNSGDERQREVLRTRIGRLRGGSAVIYCAGSSESEMRYQKTLTERTIAATRSALLEGTLPGGGTALLQCMAPLKQAQDTSDDLHERAALGILMAAVEAPCRRLLENAGHEAAGVVIDEILRGKNGAGYDLLSGSIADMREHGVIDSAAAQMAAVRNSVSGAALALTVDTIVHRVNPPLSIDPGGLPSGTEIPNIELK